MPAMFSKLAKAVVIASAVGQPGAPGGGMPDYASTYESSWTSQSGSDGSKATVGFHDYEDYVQTYAGKYQKYMSTADQGKEDGMASGNIPAYASKYIGKHAKGFQHYMEAQTGNSTWMNKYAGQSHGDYSKYYQQYMHYQNGAGQKGAGASAAEREAGTMELIAQPPAEQLTAAGWDDEYVHGRPMMQSQNYAEMGKKYEDKYAGKYGKYMSSGGQSNGMANGTTDGNIPAYANKYLEKWAKGFKKYMEAPSGVANDGASDTSNGASYFDWQKYEGGAGGAGNASGYASYYKKYIKSHEGEQGTGSSSGGDYQHWIDEYDKAKAEEAGSGSADHYHEEGMHHNSTYYKNKYRKEYADQYHEEGTHHNNTYYKNKYRDEYMPEKAKEERAARRKREAAAAAREAAQKSPTPAPTPRPLTAEERSANDLLKQAQQQLQDKQQAAAAKAAADKATADQAAQAAQQAKAQVAVDKAADAQQHAASPEATQDKQLAAQEVAADADEAATLETNKELQDIVEVAKQREAARQASTPQNLRVVSASSGQQQQQQLLGDRSTTAPMAPAYAAGFVAFAPMAMYAFFKRRENRNTQLSESLLA